MDPSSPAVRAFYDQIADQEWTRLHTPLGRVEFASTLRLVDRYFPPPGVPGRRVCDVGARPGRYAVTLATRSYRVSLVYLADTLLDRAPRAFAEAGLGPELVQHGDGRDLESFADGTFATVLLLGPLYHLTDAADRARGGELLRVLAPGGVAVAAYLSSWGLLRAGLTDFPSGYRDAETARALLRPGRTRPSGSAASPRRPRPRCPTVSAGGTQGAVGGALRRRGRRGILSRHRRTVGTTVRCAGAWWQRLARGAG